MKLSQCSNLRNFSVLLLLMLSVGYIIYNFGTSFEDLDELVKTPRMKTSILNKNMSLSDKSFWSESDSISKTNIPDDVLSRAEDLVITEKSITVDDVNVFYRESPESVDSELTLLLLHGKSFSSKTWLDLKTIGLFTAAGFRTIAVDLPGFGNSEKLPPSMENKKSEFLLHLITELKILKPVIVSPSFSGYYTLPMLVENWKLFSGFIPVAPVGHNVLESLSLCNHQGDDHHKIMRERFDSLPDYFKEQIKNNVRDMSCIETPTLVIHGEFDRSKSSALLSLLPNARTFEIPQESESNGEQLDKYFNNRLLHEMTSEVISWRLHRCYVGKRARAKI